MICLQLPLLLHAWVANVIYQEENGWQSGFKVQGWDDNPAIFFPFRVTSWSLLELKNVEKKKKAMLPDKSDSEVYQ